MNRHSLKKQKGVSIITAIFIVTGLLVLGLLIVRLMMMSSTTTINEWYSAQSLYAAEAGVDCAAYNAVYGANLCGNGANACTATECPDAQFSFTVNTLDFSGAQRYLITSTGSTNGLYGPVQRQISAEFFP
jgi:Tfp pilus assembly protein PilX